MRSVGILLFNPTLVEKRANDVFQTYLRVWAKLLNCTVVSIEYSLAPENPFPRATEECLYAYAWILNNPALFGEPFRK